MATLYYRDPDTGVMTPLHGISGQADEHVRKDGDTMTGPLVVSADISAVRGTFTGGIDVTGHRVEQVAHPVESDDAANRLYVDDRILYGPVDNVPATLEPGQLYAGY